MKILLIHQNFPGQFRRVAPVWATQAGWEVLGMGRNTAPGLPHVTWLPYKLHGEAHKNQHHYLRQMEEAVLHGQAVARALLALKAKGYVPDVIFAHPGWGETLFVRDVYPHVRLIHFCEWFYGTADSDMGFDPEFPSSFDAKARLRAWNALHLMNLENCDVGISPTQWQRSRHPNTYLPKIQLAHEGVDTALLTPDATARLTLPNGTVVKAGDPVVTYVARNLEPYRGFHHFMRALGKIRRMHPNCQAIIVGGDDVSYGQKPQGAANWREKMLAEVKLDSARTHFMGKVPYDIYRKVLQVSAVHVYLTYPFVLSWSLLEAMASECVVLGSSTAPVQEVITHGENGLLVDFFNATAIAEQVVAVLESPEKFQNMRSRAGQHVREHYSLARGDALWRKLLASNHMPPHKTV